MVKVSNVKDRVGERVGKLVVIERAANKIEVAKSGKKSVRACWLCKCDCGNEIVVSGHNLSKALSNPNSTAGTRSCGCLMGKGGLKHGQSETNVYRAWNSMIQRCTNPNSTAYASYGGRGIVVCDEWLTFEGFVKEMGERQDDMTLERINNELGYSKDNCKWATRKQQANNRRTNVKLEYNGKVMSISQWASEVGLTRYVLTQRIERGWSVERALTTPNLRN